MLRVRGESMVDPDLRRRLHRRLTAAEGSQRRYRRRRHPGRRGHRQTYRRDGDTVTLIPANLDMEPMTYRATRSSSTAERSRCCGGSDPPATRRAPRRRSRRSSAAVRSAERRRCESEWNRPWCVAGSTSAWGDRSLRVPSTMSTAPRPTPTMPAADGARLNRVTPSSGRPRHGRPRRGPRPARAACSRPRRDVDRVQRRSHRLAVVVAHVVLRVEVEFLVVVVEHHDLESVSSPS